MAKETIKSLQEKNKILETRNSAITGVANQALKLVGTIQKESELKSKRINQCQDIEQDYIQAFKHMRNMEAGRMDIKTGKKQKGDVIFSVLGKVVEMAIPVLTDLITKMEKGENKHGE